MQNTLNKGRTTVIMLACFWTTCTGLAQQAARARDLGIPFDGTPGPSNSLVDVPGVEVGMVTIIKGEGDLKVGNGPVRTGVTAILPRGKNYDPVFAGWYSLNGNGEMTGTTWIEESGFLEGPIMITNTHSVGIVRDAVVQWQYENKLFDPLGGQPDLFWALPVVAETWDGVLNDINGFHVKPEHVLEALESASGDEFLQGAVGGGTGMVCHGFKGGSGSSSRIVVSGDSTYQLAAFVQANYGSQRTLTIAGVPVGNEITDLRPSILFGEGEGSIIVVIATNAPLLPHQLKRLARRVPMGIAKTGGYGSNGSGDIFIAFSTGNSNAAKREGSRTVHMLPNDQMNPFFRATVQCTEEAILNALVAAETMVGINNNTVYELPEDRVSDLMEKYNRFTK